MAIHIASDAIQDMNKKHGGSYVHTTYKYISRIPCLVLPHDITKMKRDIPRIGFEVAGLMSLSALLGHLLLVRNQRTQGGCKGGSDK